MGTITVKGEKGGKPVTIVFDIGETVDITFDGKTDFSEESELLFEVEKRHPFGGTYFPPKESFEYYVAGCYYYLDKVISYESEGIPSAMMESEKGRIY